MIGSYVLRRFGSRPVEVLEVKDIVFVIQAIPVYDEGRLVEYMNANQLYDAMPPPYYPFVHVYGRLYKESFKSPAAAMNAIRDGTLSVAAEGVCWQMPQNPGGDWILYAP